MTIIKHYVRTTVCGQDLGPLLSMNIYNFLIVCHKFTLHAKKAAVTNYDEKFANLCWLHWPPALRSFSGFEPQFATR